MILFNRFRGFSFVLKRALRLDATYSGAVSHISQNDGLSEENVSEIEEQESFYQNAPQAGKRVPLTTDDYRELKRLRPCQPEDPHLLRISILGEPNVGKSTLTNSLVRWRVCAVSRKVHTTRRKTSAVLVEDNKQLVFLDTPGYVSPELSKKHNLESSFVMDPVRTVHNADLIAVVVDIANKWTNNRIQESVMEVLETYKDKKSILVLNKVDAMKSKSRLLSLTNILTGGVVGGVRTNDLLNSSMMDLPVENLISRVNKHHESNVPENSEEEVPADSSTRGWTSFSRVFMVSALKNDGIDDLRNFLFDEAKPNYWMYHDNLVTDQHPHEIAKLIVREKLLEYLPEEIPYVLDLKVVKWELLNSGCPKISIKIICSNNRHRRFVIGPSGKHIATCVEKSRRSMREAFRKDVVLHIAVV